MTPVSPFGRVTTPRHRPGTKPVKHDCGRFGRLTLDQIATAAGITRNAARYRVDKLKLKGDAIVQHTKQLRAPSKLKPRLMRPTLRIACKLAMAFPGQVQSAEEIMRVHPMCRTSANNYRAEIAHALQDLAA